MWRISWKGVVGHKVRYGLTALAVLLGVSFMSATLVLTDTIARSFDGLYSSIYQSTDAIVRGAQAYDPGASFTSQREPIDASLVRTVKAVPGVDAVAVGIEGYAQLVGSDGKAIGTATNGPPTLGEAWIDVKALNPLELLPGGRAPRASDEIVVDKHSADVGHLHVGDRVLVLTKLAPARFTITGIATWGSADSPLGASIAAFTPATAARVLGQPGKVDQIDVQATPGVSRNTLVQRVQAAIHTPGVEVVSGQAVTREGQDAVHQALGFFNTVLMVFALIALFVGSFLIFNTFTIVVAQRMRELALLRAVGASRAQVTASVLGEACVIGIVASAGGLVVGLGLAGALKALLDALGIAIPATGLVLAARTVVVCLALGTGVTVLSALLPARRAARVAPVAVLQEVGIDAAPRLAARVLGGVGTSAIGAAVLGTGLFASVPARVAFVGGGAAVLFVGLALLGPLVARPASAAIGAPLAWRSVPGTLARHNALRNPARTSATASALMVGVAVVALMNVVAASTKASINDVVNRAMRADYVVSSGGVAGGSSGFSPDLARSLAQLPQVSAVTGVSGGMARLYGSPTTILAADPRHVDDLFDVGVTAGNLGRMTAQGIAVSTQAAADHHLRLDSAVRVTFPTTGVRVFHVEAIYSARQMAGDYVLTVAAARQNFPLNLDFQIYVKVAPGVTPAAGRSAVEGVIAHYPNATLMDQAQFKANQSAQVDQMLNLVYGLLALALLIALIGIANTLALSVYERTHELGLLRAVGMTRRQLRATVRAESLVISLLGALEGLVVGTLLGWAMVAALRSSGITSLSIPFTRLVAVALLAGVAGIAAGAAPGRRAARLDVLRAISTE